MYNRKRFLFAGALIGIILLSWWYGFRAFFSGDDDAGKDPVVAVSNKWLKLAEAGEVDKLAEFTRSGTYEAFFERYKADTSSLGTVDSRHFRRKSSYNGNQGRLVVTEYDAKFKNRPRPVNEKIFMLENSGNTQIPYLVIDARYIVPLPYLTANGTDYVYNAANAAAGDPEALAQRWLADFDVGQLEKCAYITFPKTNFDRARFFFDISKAPIDFRFHELLKDMYKDGRPLSRTVTERKYWNGIPGASKIEVFCLTSRARYRDYTRVERVWAYKDNYYPEPVWMLYGARFGKPVPVKK